MNRGIMTLLELIDVTKEYRIRQGLFDAGKGVLQAVDRVDLSVSEGEILGLVGESGCGKSTLARLILGLERPTRGKIIFCGNDIDRLDSTRLKEFRRQAQMVFQDPFSSLNPKKTVFNTLSEPLKIHRLFKGKELTEKVAGLLEEVGLDASAMDLYPHEFSGGQRQRIGLARALATNPRLIVADEPTSALDMSIQAQIINLLLDLQQRRGLSYLFISHDLPVVQFISHRIAVMYKGVIVEVMPKDAFLEIGAVPDAKERPPYRGIPHHPYTDYLIKSVPLPDPRRKINNQMTENTAAESQPSPSKDVRDISACRFYARCPLSAWACAKTPPEWVEAGSNHFIRCHAAARP
ncbi:MAG: ABC transporter ATP-binding protein [Dissulfurimicrobium sp.]|uniref:ABC transporter ATP-binding protein n=1 Tax=Dissulfurimicrobium TaxID=1769732 RepID=UPI001EDC6729|nr:oligopeptide/dipeptide ABC transporter ATP-binding protein [Dissulfurimicrobium hydrothermale]UKL14137.1 ATP-binding cassette domain-containing protein [Dissulfurimicrobium hydrothermale]